MEFVPYNLSIKLKEKGFNEKCLFAYNDEQVINPKVVEEYGYLSDDGYYELTEDGGGKLKWDYVYIYEQQIILRNKIIVKRNFIDAPTISQVLKWLRKEHKIYMYVKRDTYHFKFRFVYEKDKPRGEFTSSVYDGFEQAAFAGIEYVLNLI